MLFEDALLISNHHNVIVLGEVDLPHFVFFVKLVGDYSTTFEELFNRAHMESCSSWKSQVFVIVWYFKTKVCIDSRFQFLASQQFESVEIILHDAALKVIGLQAVDHQLL